MGMFTGILAVLIHVVIGALCIRYVINYWGKRIKGEPVDIEFGYCLVAALFIGGIAIVAAIVTWLFSKVL